jgi:hypothetical protein
MTIVLAGLARPRQTFFVAGVASRVVLVPFCSEMVRSVGVTFLASSTMTAEVPKQALVMAISRASLSHLNETHRSP